MNNCILKTSCLDCTSSLVWRLKPRDLLQCSLRSSTLSRVLWVITSQQEKRNFSHSVHIIHLLKQIGPYFPVIMDLPHLPNCSRAPQAPTNGDDSYHTGWNVNEQNAYSTTCSTKIIKAPTIFFLEAIERDRVLTIRWIHMGANLSAHIDHDVSSAPHHCVLVIFLF